MLAWTTLIAEVAAPVAGVSSWIVGGAIFAAALLSVGAAVITTLVGRRSDVEFLPRAEFQKFQSELSESVRRLHARIDDVVRQQSNATIDSERARGVMLGKLEGFESALQSINDQLTELRSR